MQAVHNNLSSENPLIHILWDASPLWGHLVLNAVIQTGLSFSIIRTEKNGASYASMRKKLSGKILIVPGGFGRMKQEIFGEGGKNAICDFISEGGAYIGFCGGAGLALSHGALGLGLCPWGRGVYNSRLEHLVSGHLVCSMGGDKLVDSDKVLENREEISLPVWWPGRFQEPKDEERNAIEKGRPVRVIARYKGMGEDLYVADMPLTKLPQNVFEDWENLYGVTLLPHLLHNEPLVIAGEYGKGQYILSYSHLETPDSREANELFAQILCSCLKTDTQDINASLYENTPKNSYVNGFAKSFENKLACGEIEAKRICTLEQNIFNSPYSPIWLWQVERVKNAQPLLLELFHLLEELFVLGVNLHLLFERTNWLYGWHTSVPGSQLNALRVALLQSLFLKRTPLREIFFEQNSAFFEQKMRIFVSGAKTWILARKLSEVMGNTPEKASVSKVILQEQRKELFGIHMTGGGLCGELIEWLNEFLFCTE